MSRCFPFPPPGYEKARIDNTDLLKKEKQKEKKQKKDKKEKEKEKRDSKEKQDKDRSKDKHKDKKDRKEKRKDKDRDKDKDKNKTPDEKKLELQPRNGEKLSSNSIPKSVNKDNNSLHLQELAKRLRDGERASGSQMVQNVVPMVVEKRVGSQLEEKDKVRNKIESQRRVNGKNDIEKPFGHQNSVFDKRVEAITKSEEKKNVEKQVEAKEKSIELEKNKKSKDKDRVKEEKKKVKEITEPSKDQLKPNEKVSNVHQVNKDSLDFRNIKSPPESVNLITSSVGNLGKRKELERNGYLLDNGIRPNKLPRNPSFKEPSLENGKKSEPFQTAVDQTNDPRLVSNHRVDHKEQKINGSIIPQKPEMGSVKVPKGENFSKAPHPDTKYLSQILSVPKMEEWCDLDDQEWLFSSNDLQSKSSKGTLTEGTPRQVWAESFRIDSADISALPYVIPY